MEFAAIKGCIGMTTYILVLGSLYGYGYTVPQEHHGGLVVSSAPTVPGPLYLTLLLGDFTLCIVSSTYNIRYPEKGLGIEV